MPGARGWLVSPASSGGPASARPSTRSIVAARQAAGTQQHRRPRSIRRWWIRGRPRPRRHRRSGRCARRGRSCTWAAMVGETWPDRLADGATTGPPKALRISRATGWAGIRIATVSSPAVARSATAQPSVWAAPASAVPARTLRQAASPARRNAQFRRAAARSPTWVISGLNDGPALGLIEPGDRARDWWHRRRAHKRSRSGTRPGRHRRGTRAAAAVAACPAGKICVFRPTFTGSVSSIRLLAVRETQGYKPRSCRSVAQPGRALRSGRRGRRFKSCHSDHHFNTYNFDILAAQRNAQRNGLLRRLVSPILGNFQASSARSARGWMCKE